MKLYQTIVLALLLVNWLLPVTAVSQRAATTQQSPITVADGWTDPVGG